jgi:GH15 family glucan-1,4-alpha-glucosidase
MQEENKTVDIDTSGPEVDVELENDSTENELEVQNETTENNTESNDSTEKYSEQSDVQTSKQENKKEASEDELKQYSEGVQKRIAKLTKKWREAERQKDEALTYAQRIMEDKKRADEKLSKLEPGFLKSTEESIVSGLAAAKSDLAKAREAGDIEAEVAAQTKISELAYKQARFLETKTQQEEFNKAREAEVRQPEVNLNRQQASRGTPDPKAEDWASRNTWFGQDAAMTYTAFDLHKKLTEEEGYDPQSDEYYSEIDKRIRLEFPQKFANNEQKVETAKPVQTVASAKRSTKTGRKTVRLTPSQVAIAKKLGVPLEEYAKQLNITKEV